MILLDTNVVSELMRTAPEPAVVRWMNHQPSSLVHLAAVSIAEIRYGIRILPRGHRRDDLQHRFARFVSSGFAERVLDFDWDAASLYGEIVGSRREIGRPISVVDGQIAAVARGRRCQLATRNVTDFEACGLELINPWAYESENETQSATE